MSHVDSLYKAISNAKTKVFRKLFIKRRLLATGLFESDWLELTDDVKKWGSIRTSTDTSRYGVYTIDGMAPTFQNDSGRYNPETDINSIWYGYLPPQRSLVKIESGFYVDSLGSDLIWDRTYYPDTGYWDESEFDGHTWDSSYQVFTGLVYGELSLSDHNEVTMQVKPLTQVFRDYPASLLVGLTTGVSASGIVSKIRDQTDGGGNYIFLPFFGDTTGNFVISTTSNVLNNLSTNTAEDIRDKTCWDVIEKLAGAENFTAFVTPDGQFHFVSRTPADDVAYNFYGLGHFNTEFGHTIKQVSKFGLNYDRYYSSVRVKFNSADTITSYVSTSSSFAISGTNTAWRLGVRTLDIENVWIANSTVAATIANSLFNEFSTTPREVEFTTSFIPHLTLLDRVAIYYDTTNRAVPDTLWNQNDWDTELTWDRSRGEAIILNGEEFKFISIDINLDSFECKYVAREI